MFSSRYNEIGNHVNNPADQPYYLALVIENEESSIGQQVTRILMKLINPYSDLNVRVDLNTCNNNIRHNGD